MECDKAIAWLEARLSGELVECRQFCDVSQNKDYWRGRIASIQEALKIVRGVGSRLGASGNHGH